MVACSDSQIKSWQETLQLLGTDEIDFYDLSKCLSPKKVLKMEKINKNDPNCVLEPGSNE
jgi:hypothetical protein